MATYFFDFDARIQDSLASRDEAAANGYLLARGLAECYWGLGPDESWTEAPSRPVSRCCSCSATIAGAS